LTPGCGWFLLKLTDMKKGIQETVVEKMQLYFTSSDFVKTNQTYLQSTARRVLATNFGHFQKGFQALLSEKKKNVVTQNENRIATEQEIRQLTSFEVKTRTLLQELNQLSLSE
jgi:hypothetical protein